VRDACALPALQADKASECGTALLARRRGLRQQDVDLQGLRTQA